MRHFLASVLGGWFAVATVAAFVRVARPKSTAVTCAWCGHPVPMETALSGGIGAVNRAMREHMVACPLHPMSAMREELIAARDGLQTIYHNATDRPSDPLEGTLRERMDRIRNLAAALY